MASNTKDAGLFENLLTTVLVLFFQALTFMLAFDILHEHFKRVPAFSLMETLVLCMAWNLATSRFRPRKDKV